jgi:serine/threonine protein kinase
VALSVGARVGPYEVVSLLGAGGMGEVYRAHDANLRRDVAIKILSGLVAAAPDRVARLEREARALAALNHPHIATIHGVEVGVPDSRDGRGSQYALVLELVEGDTLEDVIRRGPVPLREALAIARAIADALEAAHEKGIVHRDLKPANVKITPAGVVKVLDFGLAKGADDEPKASHLPTIGATRAGVVLGTAAYMSPEQARGKPVDKRTDIWAFGCVLYEMVTGEVAFSGETLSDVIVAVLEREPEWAKLPASTPLAVTQLLRRCFEKDQRRRLRDIGDARLAIEDVLANRDNEPATAIRPLPRWTVPAAVASGVAIGAIAMQVLGSRSIPSAKPRQVRFTIQLPSDSYINPTQNRQEAISPDGTLIAYVGRRNGQRTMYVRRVDELEGKPIDNLGEATGPFFSPDGQWLGFFRAGGGGVMKVALSGGAPVLIARPNGAQGAAWGEDGTVVFINGSLFRVPAAGGEIIETAKPDTAHGERWFRAPQFLPGGKTVLLTVSTDESATYDDARIVALNLETGAKKTLIEGGMSARYSASGHIVYARNGSLLAVPFDAGALRVTGPPFEVLRGVFMSINSGFAEFDIAQDGTLIYSPGEVEGGERVPVWVDRQGNAEPLPLPPRSYLHPRLSRDERQLAIEIEGATHDLYSYDFARSTLTRLTLDGMSHWPLWTPAGDRITFRSFRTNAFTMWSMPADRSGTEERLTTSAVSESAGSWSPDGKALAFTQSNPDTGSDVYVLPTEGGRAPIPIANSRFTEGSPKFSPDGKWIAYSSTESGRPEIYTQSWPPGGPRMQVSTEGGTDPLWSRNSSELFYRNGDKMMVTKVTPGERLVLAKTTLLWTGHYAAGMSSSCGVPGPTSANYDVTGDGQRFLMIRDKDQDLVGRQLNVLVNWVPQPAR